MLGLAGYIRDVTERKNTEQALKHLNETLEQRVADRTKELQQQTRILHSVLNSMSDGVIVVDEKGQIILHNPAMERIGGRRDQVKRVLDRDPSTLLKPDGVSTYRRDELPLSRVLAGESANLIEMFIKHPDTGGRWASAAAVPLLDEHGQRRARSP